jgi:hypothetical protein
VTNLIGQVANGVDVEIAKSPNGGGSNISILYDRRHSHVPTKPIV